MIPIAKAIASMLLLYFSMALCVGIVAGGGGFAATSLTEVVAADDLTLPVISTSGFLSSADYVEIKGEKVLYAGTTATSFTECVRGYDGTTAQAYPAGTMVYSTSASTVNNAIGFNIAATVDSMGLWSIITIPFMFLTRTLPQLLLMPYQLFKGDLVIIAVILVLIQVAVAITIAMSFIGARRV